MTPAARAALIARAKSLAIPVASCVAARLRPDHLLRDASRDDLAALVIVLAEAADPGVLRAVVTVRDDDGRPDLTAHQAKLRKAHTEVVQLRKARRPVPEQLRVLDNAYRLEQKRQAAADPRPEAGQEQQRREEAAA